MNDFQGMPAGGLTTHEKVSRAVDEIMLTPPAQLTGKARELIGGLQMAAGIAGIDLVEALVPADPTDADVLVDNMLSLLLDMRGDDLAPFDFARHYRERADALAG